MPTAAVQPQVKEGKFVITGACMIETGLKPATTTGKREKFGKMKRGKFVITGVCMIKTSLQTVTSTGETEKFGAEFVIWLKKELGCFAGAVGSHERPRGAIVGGAKVSTKIPVIESMLNKVDKLVIGGGMVLTFVKARGLAVGGSLVEEDMLHLAKKLPSDVACGDDFPADGKEVGFKVVPAIGIPDGWLGLDYGPDTTEIKRPWLTASDLERPHGRVREPAVLQGHPRDCRVPGRDHGEGRCHHHHRRWRLRVGRKQVGARSEDVAHLRGRRREPGAPGGQGVAGGCSAG